MICAPIVARNHTEAERQLALATKQPIDLVELRLDHWAEKPDLARLLGQACCPVIVTCRPHRQGGHFNGSEEERLSLLQEAARLGAAYIDVEADCVTAIKATGATKIIASYHNFTETPADLAAIVKRLEALPADIVKFATMATGLDDNLRVFQVLQDCRKPAIGICMGELGEVSRILALRYGSWLTFGSLAAGKESAPGQLSAIDLAQLYRVRDLTEKSRLFAVVGDPIAHSLSPEIHNTALAQLEIDAVYLRFRVHDFESFLREVAEPLGLRGLSVTLPHKEAALRAAVEANDLARAIGAVNTLTRVAGGWRGDNTDCAAALDAIRAAAERADVVLAGARALLLGAGGAARALGFGLKQAGCKLIIANRTRARAEALAAELEAGVMTWEEAHRGEFQVIANTTSVGMHPEMNATPIDPVVFKPGQVVFDAVYHPRETRMLREARAQGTEIVDGVRMFVGQAARQFETWTGRAAPGAAMEAVVTRRLAGLQTKTG